MKYLEPVYLNEKMVLNAAAYLFQGVRTEAEEKESAETGRHLNLSAGIEFLNGLLGRVGGAAEIDRRKSREVTATRRYTLGGLHMTVLDELTERGALADVTPRAADDSGGYIQTKAVLYPVDIYQLVATLQTSAPLIVQVLRNFGTQFGVNRKQLDELLNYEKAITNIIEAIAQDYLVSNQLEMVLCDPTTGDKFGLVDLDVTDYDPQEIKSKLTDGCFVVIGKITKLVEMGDSLSLVQRTFLSYVMHVLDTLAGLGDDAEALEKYKKGINEARPYVERFCQLSISGPAYRLMAMSVCA